MTKRIGIVDYVPKNSHYLCKKLEQLQYYVLCYENLREVRPDGLDVLLMHVGADFVSEAEIFVEKHLQIRACILTASPISYKTQLPIIYSTPEDVLKFIEGSP